MADRPLDIPTWATDATYSATGEAWDGQPTKVAPAPSKQAEGVEPGERFPADHFNWLLNGMTGWVSYLAPIPLANWTVRQADAASSPTAATAVASRPWAGERDAFMAIFDAGANHIAQRSPAGDGWKDTGTGITGALYDVAWMGGTVNRWILVGAAGAIWYRAGNATDGTAWSSTGPGSGDDFYAVAVNDDATLAVAVGENGRIYTSTDGAAWTSRTSGTTADLLGVAYGGGLWVAVGTAAGDDFVITSSDGVTWTAAGTGSASFGNVVYDPAHGVFVTTDGTNVYQVSTAGVLSTVVGTLASGATALATDGHGTIIAVIRTSILVSSDAGATWSGHIVMAQGTGNTSTTVFYDATWNESLGCFVAVGTDDGVPMIAQSMRTA